MILSHPTHHDVLHVCRNLRPIDAEEIYGLRFEDNPFHLMNDVMAQRNFAWVAWCVNKPAAVFGGAPIHPGVWRMFAFGTSDFYHIARPLTRFAKQHVIPKLFGELGAHRLEADSHQNHTRAHRWLGWLGATQESVRQHYGRDGSNYLHFALLKSVDFGKSTK